MVSQPMTSISQNGDIQLDGPIIAGEDATGASEAEPTISTSESKDTEGDVKMEA